MVTAVDSYVALGDSFSAGVPGQTPWPELAANALADHSPGLYFGNFARVGVASHEVAADQLGPALARQPDLVSLVCGANDVIQSVRPDAHEFARTLAAMLDRIAAAAPRALIATATYPPVSPGWCRPRTRARVHDGIRAFNAAVRRVSAERRVVCLDWERRSEVGMPQMFAADGFHPSQHGHRLAAGAFIAAVDAALEPQIQTEVA